MLAEATKGELGYNEGVSAVCLVAPATAREMRVQRPGVEIERSSDVLSHRYGHDRLAV